MNYYNKENIDINKRLVFITSSYKNNYNTLDIGDNIITEYTGAIHLRSEDFKESTIIGHYSYVTININMAKLLNINVNTLIKKMNDLHDKYVALSDSLKASELNIHEYDTLTYLDHVIIHPQYRKKDVTHEFLEYMYNTHIQTTKKPLFLGFIKPIQHVENNPTKNIMIFDDISLYDYYFISQLNDVNDDELIKYKLYGLAQKLGFEQLHEDIFKLNPNNIKKRMLEKYNSDNYSDIVLI